MISHPVCLRSLITDSACFLLNNLSYSVSQRIWTSSGNGPLQDIYCLPRNWPLLRNRLFSVIPFLGARCIKLLTTFCVTKSQLTLNHTVLIDRLYDYEIQLPPGFPTLPGQLPSRRLLKNSVCIYIVIFILRVGIYNS